MKKTLLIIAVFISIGIGVLSGMYNKPTYYTLYPSQDRKVTISLTIQEVDLIMRGLAELPMKESGNLYFNIQAQAQSQLQAQQQKPLPKQDSTTPKKKP
jgi:hypothetical protein